MWRPADLQRKAASMAEAPALAEGTALPPKRQPTLVQSGSVQHPLLGQEGLEVESATAQW